MNDDVVCGEQIKRLLNFGQLDCLAGRTRLSGDDTDCRVVEVENPVGSACQRRNRPSRPACQKL
jgi:hypothetical protein